MASNPVGQQDRIGDDAMHLPHVDRLVHGLPPAPALARMLTNASGRGRQWVIHDDRFERIRQASLLIELQEARNVHVERTAVLARCKREILTHAGPAALGADVVLEFVAEMAQRSQHRVRCRLAEPAERGVADHPAQFVEFGEILLATLTFGDARQGAQRLVETDAARARICRTTRSA